MSTEIEIKPVDPERWDDFEALFDGPGGPKSCWCMIWRSYARDGETTDKAARKHGMRERILRGDPVGLLGYDGGTPIGWCSIAPRRSFKSSLDGNRQEQSEGLWCLTCLFVKRSHRGEGLSDRMIDAALHYARTQGGVRVEAFPVEPNSPSYRFCGFTPQFRRLGFQETGKVGSRRKIFAKDLRGM